MKQLLRIGRQLSFLTAAISSVAAVGLAALLLDVLLKTHFVVPVDAISSSLQVRHLLIAVNLLTLHAIVMYSFGPFIFSDEGKR